MKSTIKYVLIAAAVYYLYKKFKDNTSEQLPDGSGGAGRPQNPPLLEAIQGVKQLPYTY